MTDFQFAIVLLNIWGVGYSISERQSGWLAIMTLVWFLLAVSAWVSK